MAHVWDSMTDAIKAVAGGPPPRVRPQSPPRRARRPAPASMTQAVQKVAKHKRNPATTRAGRKGIVIYVEQDVATGIHRLAADYDATVQALGEMAFKYLFEKFGEPWPA